MIERTHKAKVRFLICESWLIQIITFFTIISKKHITMSEFLFLNIFSVKFSYTSVLFVLLREASLYFYFDISLSIPEI